MKIKDLPIRLDCYVSVVDFVGFSHCGAGFEELYNGLYDEFPDVLKDKYVLSISVDSGVLKIMV